jgi:hypothetical protein
MLGNYRVATQLVASRVVLSSTELVRPWMPPYRSFPVHQSHIIIALAYSTQMLTAVIATLAVFCLTAPGMYWSRVSEHNTNLRHQGYTRIFNIVNWMLSTETRTVSHDFQSKWIRVYIYIYIYTHIYMCVCVCVCESRFFTANKKFISSVTILFAQYLPPPLPLALTLT